MSAVFMAALTANAQEKKSEYIFNPHAFITVQGGAQYTLGEAKFKDLISPNVQLGIGYQFNSWFGARLAANAWQSKGGYNGYDDNNLPGNVTYKYKYVAPGIDFMFNLSNAIWGFNPMRVVNVTAFIGGGANIAFKNDDANDLYKKGYTMSYIWDGTKVRAVGRAGLDVDFRICDRFSIGVEGNANILSDHYNSKKAGNADWYFNALVGFKVNLGKTYKKVEAPAEIIRTVEPEPQKKVEEAAPVKQEVKKAEEIRRDIFFNINTIKVSASEESKVQELANYLKNNPDTKMEITGYADANTGTDAINSKLAKQRAQSVADELTGKYGISKDRISVSSEGAKVQPFSVNDKNRVSICVSKK